MIEFSIFSTTESMFQCEVVEQEDNNMSNLVSDASHSRMSQLPSGHIPLLLTATQLSEFKNRAGRIKSECL